MKIKTILFGVLIFFLIGVASYTFTIGKYGGSISDDIDKEIVAEIICYNVEEKMRITWEFEELNISEAINARNYATENNCEFKTKLDLGNDE
jgi:hypothetical protein